MASSVHHGTICASWEKTEQNADSIVLTDGVGGTEFSPDWRFNRLLHTVKIECTMSTTLSVIHLAIFSKWGLSASMNWHDETWIAFFNFFIELIPDDRATWARKKLRLPFSSSTLDWAFRNLQMRYSTKRRTWWSDDWLEDFRDMLAFHASFWKKSTLERSNRSITGSTAFGSVDTWSV